MSGLKTWAKNMWWGEPDKAKVKECTEVAAKALYLCRLGDMSGHVSYVAAVRDCQIAANRNGRDEGTNYRCLMHERYLDSSLRNLHKTND